jgi:GT2 family glycosyltransferase
MKSIAQQPLGAALNRLFLPRTVLLACDLFQPSIPEPVKMSDTILVSGWALSSPPVKRIRIYVDDAFVGFANYRILRPDVLEAYPQFHDSEFSGFRKLIILDAFEKGLHRLKIVAENDVYVPTFVEGLIEVEESHYLHTPHFVDETLQASLKAKISVIILTKEPPADFEQTLERLRTQKGVPQPEIVIINSGKSDLNSLAKYNVRSYKIQPEQFSHSGTRNYAARKAKGDYIVFLSDDAIPAKNDLLLNMVRILENDHTIAAVTARQLPRSDSDLISCFAIWGHYRALRTDKDEIVGSDNLDEITTEQKRASCQIDDVCSCYNRKVFLKYKYSDAASYGEDLELGTRLVKDGFKIARLFSTGVTHSHNRAAAYYLKRSYVDFKALSWILGYRQPDFGPWRPKSLDDCIDLILHLHRSLNVAVDSLVESAYCNYDIDESFSMLSSRLSDEPGSAEARLGDADLQNFLKRITIAINYQNTTHAVNESNPLVSQYLATLAMFGQWLSESRETLRDLESEFVKALYKLLAAHIGGFLGKYFVYTKATAHDDEKTLILDKLLSEGV